MMMLPDLLPPPDGGGAHTELVEPAIIVSVYSYSKRIPFHHFDTGKLLARIAGYFF
jgi:hypothetical protein